jgi:ATP-dependent helicase/nuclease subunit A
VASDKKPRDQAVRDEVTGRLDTTFLLEAGAGSGKTSVLVGRYVNCVLDPERGTRDVSKVAAITFTEKAAGELRQRVREEFEKRARAAEQGSEQAGVIEGALDDLDDAPINTIHGFAARLLREFPVEAGIDPAFEQLDGLGSEIELARLWEEWLTEIADDARDEPARRWLSRLLRAGVKLDKVRELAVGKNGVFGERYDLEPVEGPPGEPNLAFGLTGLASSVDRLRTLCDEACTDHESDKGFTTAMKLVEASARLLEDLADPAGPPADVDQLAAAVFALPVSVAASAPGGAKGNWEAAAGGKEELQRRYQTVRERVTDLREDYAAFVTGLAVAVAWAFSAWAADKLLQAGRLDFADLLGRLRNLLAGKLTKGDLAARVALQHRFRYLLVDEFQDTDPLQAEIVFFLCERAESEPKAANWSDVALEPGKLFVVGDPKQSIYRFRRADIRLYGTVEGLIKGQRDGTGMVRKLSQNFRSTPAVVEWVNDVFRDVFVAEEGRQPGYEPVEPHRPPAEGPRVAVLRGLAHGDPDAKADAVRRAEARAVAALLARMHGDDAGRWQIQDREKKADAGSEPVRAPRWGDIAVLFRATTGLEAYEQALRDSGVPYRVEGGKAYFSRREVDDALLCLRAVDDPSDGPAVYGALHSSLFGFSDDELFLFWSKGGRFDPSFEGPAKEHVAVVAALHVLRDLHEERAVHEPHELIAKLVRLVYASEFLAATGAGAAQAIANLEKLVERARAYSKAGGGGLGEFLVWAAQAGDAAGEQESLVDDDGDVVHLSTIHKAKGLEHPIVVLVGGSLGGGGGGGEPIVDRERHCLAIKLKAELPGAAPRDLEPQAYTSANETEKLMRESEMRRLLYVAVTRARDHLVLAHFGKLKTKAGEPASGVLLAPIADQLPAVNESTEEYVEGGVLVLPPGEPPARAEGEKTVSAETLLDARDDWMTGRARLLAKAAQPARATSPSALEHVDEEVRSGGPGAPPGRAKALALGSAVHRIMELCDLQDEASIARVAAGVTRELGRPDLTDEAVELATACWRAAPVRAAAVAAAADPGAVFRELPIGALIGDVIVSGAIDLLYRDGEEWVVVDYKTDRGADGDALRARYSPQGAAYAVAVEAALLGDRVREVAFVAARAGGLAVMVPVDDGLRDAARTEVATAAALGRAVGADELADD